MNFKRLFDLSSNQNQKTFEKRFAALAARAVFVSSFMLQKQLIFDFLAGNNSPKSPHSQGGMKFATQISPLLNYLCLLEGNVFMKNCGITLKRGRN